MHLITLDPGEGRNPMDDYDALRQELAKFDADLASKPEIVALSKYDLPEVREAYPELRDKFEKRGIELHALSGATGEGTERVMQILAQLVTGNEKEPWEEPGSNPAGIS